MKKILTFTGILIFTAFLISVFAADRRISDYVVHGAFDYHVVQTAIDSNSALGSQIKHRPINATFTLSITADDTNWHFIGSVPAGMTGTVRAAKITCETEPDDNGNTDARAGLCVYDASAAALLKMGTEFALDADSAYLVKNVMTAMTLDSVTALAAGDIIWLRTWCDSANVILDGGGISLDIDYEE